MHIFDTLKKSPLMEMLQDPRLRELVTRREFTISRDELQREILSQTAGEEGLQDLTVQVGEGFLEISGRVKKRMLPFAIPFSASFSLHSLEFSPRSKTVHLKLEELKPFEIDSLTKKLVEKLPFLTFANGLVTIQLEKVPRLAALLGCQIGSFRPFDHIVLKRLSFMEGEVTGSIGVLL
jgi:hypothetical protein